MPQISRSFYLHSQSPFIAQKLQVQKLLGLRLSICPNCELLVGCWRLERKKNRYLARIFFPLDREYTWDLLGERRLCSLSKWGDKLLEPTLRIKFGRREGSFESKFINNACIRDKHVEELAYSHSPSSLSLSPTTFHLWFNFTILYIKMFGAQQPPTGPSSMTRSSSFGGGPSAKKATFSFGNPSTTNTTTQPATTGFSFGQSQQNTQPSTSTTANTGFSFGASTNNQTQPAAPASSGFSFGNNNNNNNTTSTTGGGLFGNNNNNNSQPQSTGFSFGNNQQTQQNQQQQPQSTGAFSFGQSTAQKPAGTFSFGNSTNNNASISQPQQQQQGGISLFGQSQNQPAGFGQRWVRE